VIFLGEKWVRKKYDGKGTFSELNSDKLALNASTTAQQVFIVKPEKVEGPPFETIKKRD
jgi:hypothetical protein